MRLHSLSSMVMFRFGWVNDYPPHRLRRHFHSERLISIGLYKAGPGGQPPW